MSSAGGVHGMGIYRSRPIGPEPMSPGAEELLREQREAQGIEMLTVNAVGDAAPGNDGGLVEQNGMEHGSRSDRRGVVLSNGGEEKLGNAGEDEVEIVAVNRYGGGRSEEVNENNERRRSGRYQEHNTRGLKHGRDELGEWNRHECQFRGPCTRKRARLMGDQPGHRLTDNSHPILDGEWTEMSLQPPNPKNGRNRRDGDDVYENRPTRAV